MPAGGGRMRPVVSVISHAVRWPAGTAPRPAETRRDQGRRDRSVIARAKPTDCGSLTKMPNVGRQSYPRVHRLFPHGQEWRGKCRIGERTDRNDHMVGKSAGLPIHAGTTLRTEVKADRVPAVGDAGIDFARAFNPHLRFREKSTAMEDAAGPALAGLAVTYIDPFRISRCHRAERSAVALRDSIHDHLVFPKPLLLAVLSMNFHPA